ncbi:hypothetical protein ACFYVR_19085 [Rhodococcus sp. NPDC003318]|uniref:hypothetical protein n=1 Tax=Rhodococcus sp. NPDC003318 TaxID=3364503 RepID=UPI00368671EE
MAIEHYSLLSEEGWADSSVDQVFPANFWSDGGVVDAAEVEKALKGNLRISTKVDTSFHVNGLRLAPGFSLPRRRSNLDGQVIVLGGQFTITGEEDGATVSGTIGPGEFWTITAGTPHVMTAGPEGVTYLETWSEPLEKLEMYWYEADWADR